MPSRLDEITSGRFGCDVTTTPVTSWRCEIAPAFKSGPTGSVGSILTRIPGFTVFAKWASIVPSMRTSSSERISMMGSPARTCSPGSFMMLVMTPVTAALAAVLGPEHFGTFLIAIGFRQLAFRREDVFAVPC